MPKVKAEEITVGGNATGNPLFWSCACCVKMEVFMVHVKQGAGVLGDQGTVTRAPVVFSRRQSSSSCRVSRAACTQHGRAPEEGALRPRGREGYLPCHSPLSVVGAAPRLLATGL